MRMLIAFCMWFTLLNYLFGQETFTFSAPVHYSEIRQLVIPEATCRCPGSSLWTRTPRTKDWIPAFAGMTEVVLVGPVGLESESA